MHASAPPAALWLHTGRVREPGALLLRLKTLLCSWLPLSPLIVLVRPAQQNSSCLKEVNNTCTYMTTRPKDFVSHQLA
jgi:hypothetical protein